MSGNVVLTKYQCHYLDKQVPLNFIIIIIIHAIVFMFSLFIEVVCPLKGA